MQLPEDASTIFMLGLQSPIEAGSKTFMDIGVQQAVHNEAVARCGFVSYC